MSLKDKTIIITGASSGIGKACAQEFARAGANVVLAARQYDALSELSTYLQDTYKIKAKAVKCDVTNEDDCRRMVQEAIDSFGRIDVLINNAGMTMRALFKDLDLVVIRKLMDVNFWGSVYCTKYALPHLLKTKGSVVGVTSIGAYRGLPGRTGYSASKYALNGFMEALRVENLKTGLHVMLAAPGFTASNIRTAALVKDGSAQGESSLEEGKMMTAQEVASIILEGVLKRERSLIMTVQGKLTVLLSKLFPSWVDKQVFKIYSKEKDPLF